MTRLQTYLTLVPLPIIVLAGFIYLVAILMVPARYRLQTALAFTVIWLAANKFADLRAIQPLAKTTAFAGYLAIAMAALLDPGPKRRMPRLVWLYPIMAVAAFVYILRSAEGMLDVVIRFQWLMLVIAAILLVRTITDSNALMRVINGFAVGYLLTTLILLSALILDPRGAYVTGVGRFAPYGGNANQTGLMLSQAGFFAFYMAFRGRANWLKPVFLGLAGIALGLALLTGSRSVVFATALPILPLVATIVRRPFVAALGFVIIAGMLIWLFQLGEQSRLERLYSLESSRYEQWRVYFNVFKERPFFGILSAPGYSSRIAPRLTFHPHNAYLDILYVGGLSYGLPMFMLVFLSLGYGFYIFKHRKLLPTDPVLISCLCLLLLTVYVHGFVNGIIYSPTYAWSVIHVFLAVLMITLGIDMRKYVRSRSGQAY